jgi:hypothetical protein
MPSFGVLDAVEKALAPTTAALFELLRGINAEQRRTNELLGQLIEAKVPRKAASK